MFFLVFNRNDCAAQDAVLARAQNHACLKKFNEYKGYLRREKENGAWFTSVSKHVHMTKRYDFL